MRNDAGTIYRIAGIAEDITERIEAQEKLENNARQLEKTNDELSQARGLLERRVAERTAALRDANNQLRRQINERKRLENELLEIAEKERRRIGIDLHDELGQHLNGIALMLKGLELKLEKRALPEAAESAKIQGLIFKTIQQARAVARDLASPDIEGDDLTSALKRWPMQTTFFRLLAICICPNTSQLSPNQWSSNSIKSPRKRSPMRSSTAKPRKWTLPC